MEKLLPPYSVSKKPALGPQYWLNKWLFCQKSKNKFLLVYRYRDVQHTYRGNHRKKKKQATRKCVGSINTKYSIHFQQNYTWLARGLGGYYQIRQCGTNKAVPTARESQDIIGTREYKVTSMFKIFQITGFFILYICIWMTTGKLIV